MGQRDVAKKGDTVRVHYRGRFDDGTLFGSTEGDAPIEFTLGKGQVIPGVEQAVEGMEVGEEASTKVSPDRGFGPRRDELLLTVARGEFPGDRAPSPGDRFEMRSKAGAPVTVTVQRVADDTVEVDANHPLAGRVLNFDLELVEIA